MAKGADTGWHDGPVGPSPSFIGVSPSNISRCLSSTPGLSTRGWLLAAILLVAGGSQRTGAYGTERTGDLGTAVVTEAPFTVDKTGGLFLMQGARKRHSAQAVDGSRFLAAELVDDCITSPLWDKEVDPANYEFGCKEIEEMLDGSKKLIGNGQVRDVYFVKYSGKIVVLKVLQESGSPRRREAVLQMHKREVLSLDAVRGHPNIVGMLGICNTTLVTEYYPSFLDQVIWVKRDRFSFRKVIYMALDAARGLQALHEASVAPIVHFDMKPRQLLIDDRGRLMLNDFNAAQFMDARGSGLPCQFTMRACRAVVWRSPENQAGKPLTEKVDIYAMGMIFFSLISGRLPLSRTESGNHTSVPGERPYIDPSWHPDYMKIVQGMWQHEPKDRPSARQVVARLEGIVDSLP